MPDTKNFRSNYYEKIGFKSVDIKKSLESILSESVLLDKAKLAQFVIKYELPAQYRVVVWKYLLDVSSTYKEASEFVWEQRREQFQVLLQSLITMRRLPPSPAPPQMQLRVPGFGGSESHEEDDESDRRRATMSSMVALEEDRLPWADGSDTAMVPISPRRIQTPQPKAWEEDFRLVFDLVEDSLAVEDDVEMYWICRNLYKTLWCRKHVVQAQIKEVESYLWRKDPVLAAHLDSGGVFRWPAVSSVLTDLLRCAFAGVFRYEAVISLWDKIVAGSDMGEVFVLAEILLTHRNSLMTTPTTLILEKLEKITREIPVVNQHTIIDRAFEVWQLEFGGVLHPNLIAPVAGTVTPSTSAVAPAYPPSTFPATTGSSSTLAAADTRPKMSMDATNAQRYAKSNRKFSQYMK